MKRFAERWIIVFWILFFVGMATTPLLAVPLIAVFWWLYAQVIIELFKSIARFFKSDRKSHHTTNGISQAVPKNYNEYISSGAWETLRDHTLAWMNHRCEFCSGRAYQVHHIRYPSKKVYFGTESIKSLASVCSPCHSILHGAPAPLNGNSCVFCGSPGVASLTVAYDHYSGKERPWVCKKCDLISRGYRRTTLGMTQDQYDVWVQQWREAMPTQS